LPEIGAIGIGLGRLIKSAVSAETNAAVRRSSREPRRTHGDGWDAGSPRRDVGTVSRNIRVTPRYAVVAASRRG
jgi:hypothetical protein